VFNSETAGDCRYGPGIFTPQPGYAPAADPQAPNTPVAFNTNNVIGEGNSYWQNIWRTAVPGILFAPTSTSGANIAALSAMEAQVKAGIEQ